MKIVVASDSYKGSLSSLAVAEAVSEGVLSACPSAGVTKVEVADGGEGTLGAIVNATGGDFITTRVSDPLNRPILAKYGIIHGGSETDTAVIEVAQAIGLTLMTPEERNPLLASSKGVGELIKAAWERGCRDFIICLGGSGTNDGGRGMMEVPGIRDIAREGRFTVMCDVKNTFIGPNGATMVFGPQKGATPQMLGILEERMTALAAEIEAETGMDVRELPGAGAAGGLGGAFAAWFSAELKSGIDVLLDTIGFDSLISGADLVITGEGCADSQTASGKAALGVLRRAQSQGIPTALLAGKVIDAPKLESLGFQHVIAVSDPAAPLSIQMNPQITSSRLRDKSYDLITNLFNKDVY